MKEVDSIVQSFDIQDDEIEFERDEEGNDLVLGHGAFGQVSTHLTLRHRPAPWHRPAPAPAVGLAPKHSRFMSCYCTAWEVCCSPVQVYKGLRGGIQDVAVKVLFDADEGALSRFIKVRP
jgi:hypothetical protein